VWRDLEVRYGLNETQFKDDQVASLPDDLEEHDVLVVESLGFFHAGLEGSETQVKERVRRELLNHDYAKNLANKGKLFFVLSQAHHEWDSDDAGAASSHSWGLSQPQQEAYHTAAVAALKDSAWNIIDTFSPTRARPTVRRASRVAFGASGDGAQYSGITVPFLHELCQHVQ
jgi:hypothetical protein